MTKTKICLVLLVISLIANAWLGFVYIYSSNMIDEFNEAIRLEHELLASYTKWAKASDELFKYQNDLFSKHIMAGTIPSTSEMDIFEQKASEAGKLTIIVEQKSEERNVFNKSLKYLHIIKTSIE